MAQNDISLMGAVYPDVPAVTLPIDGGGTAKFTDVSDTTASASDVAQGKYFYTAAGVLTEGTASGGGGGAAVITDTTDTHGGTIRTITTADEYYIQESKTVTPSSSQQVITPDSGYDALESVTVEAVAAGSVSVSATKGTVSNHSVSVTPSATKTAGLITSGTVTGTAVSVSASELVSGTYSVTSSGTKDVTNYASASVPAGSVTAPSSVSGTGATVNTGANTITLNKTLSVTPNVTTAGYVSSGTAGNMAIGLTATVTTKAATTYRAGTSDQTISAGTYLAGTQTIAAVSQTNLSAENIKNGTTISISNGQNNIWSVTGTYTGSGGTSNWTLVASKELTYNTTSTSSALIEWWDTGHTEIWTSSNILYIRIRDKAGKRTGYFFGSDNFFINPYESFKPGSASSTISARFTEYVDSSGYYSTGNHSGTTGYGVYAQSIEEDGQIRLQGRYSSTYGTVNGTYSIEVYTLSMPTGKPIFE